MRCFYVRGVTWIVFVMSWVISYVLGEGVSNCVEGCCRAARGTLLMAKTQRVNGAFSVHRFKGSFGDFIRVGFIRGPNTIRLFGKTGDDSSVLLQLSTFAPVPLVGKRALVFFSRIRGYPRVIATVGFLISRKSCHCVLDNSLLKIRLGSLHSRPIKCVNIGSVCPLSFRRFVSYMNIDSIIVRSLRST